MRYFEVMPINPKSSWPFTPFLVKNVIEIEKAAAAPAATTTLKKMIVCKTVERFFRAGAKVMEHYGMPADLALTIAREQIIREGGKVAKTQIEVAEAAKSDALEKKVIAANDASGDLVAGWLDAAKKGTNDAEGK